MIKCLQFIALSKGQLLNVLELEFAAGIVRKQLILWWMAITVKNWIDGAGKVLAFNFSFKCRTV